MIRRGLETGRADGLKTSAITGLPVVSVGRVITTEDVRSLDDEQ